VLIAVITNLLALTRLDTQTMTAFKRQLKSTCVSVCRQQALWQLTLTVVIDSKHRVIVTISLLTETDSPTVVPRPSVVKRKTVRLCQCVWRCAWPDITSPLDFLAEFFFNKSGWTKSTAGIRIIRILSRISIFG